MPYKDLFPRGFDSESFKVGRFKGHLTFTPDRVQLELSQLPLSALLKEIDVFYVEQELNLFNDGGATSGNANLGLISSELIEDSLAVRSLKIVLKKFGLRPANLREHLCLGIAHPEVVFTHSPLASLGDLIETEKLGKVAPFSHDETYWNPAEILARTESADKPNRKIIKYIRSCMREQRARGLRRVFEVRMLGGCSNGPPSCSGPRVSTDLRFFLVAELK